MLDLEELWKLQTDGAQQLATLLPTEKSMLQSDLALLTNGIITESMKHEPDVGSLVLNAYRCGVAIGLQLTIENGVIKPR